MKNELTHLMPLLLKQSGHKPTLRVNRVVYPDGRIVKPTNKQQP